MSLAKERSIAHEPPFLMNALDNPISPKSQYSSSPDHQEFDKDKRSNGSDQDGRSVIDFRAFLMSSSSSSTDQSLLSFDPKEDQMISGGYNHWNNNNHNNSRFGSDYGCLFQTASDYSVKGNQNNGSSSADGSSYGWLCSDQSTVTTDNSFDESGGTQESTGYNNKRPNMGEISTQAAKKQCSTGSTNSATNSKKPKDQKPSHVSKDPQSIAAKNRRERISERLKVLQELVPNGSKVDLVTMLEKAIGYVKFLQLQVKVLATDEFWPVQGGKAPDISQVREAIDAILSSPSQRERNSCSK